MEMPELQTERTPALTSISTQSTRNFDLALHVAAANSAESMSALRECVCDCVQNMKDSGVGTVQMILTIKACAKGSALRYRPLGDEHPQSNVDLLLDEIVKWSIIEFYNTHS
jgi:hypothetical protein